LNEWLTKSGESYTKDIKVLTWRMGVLDLILSAGTVTRYSETGNCGGSTGQIITSHYPNYTFQRVNSFRLSRQRESSKSTIYGRGKEEFSNSVI